MEANAENAAMITLYLDHGRMKMVASMDPASSFKSIVKLHKIVIHNFII